MHRISRPMTQPLTLHQRRREPNEAELESIPWLKVLQKDEYLQVASRISVADAQPGDYVCRVGRPVTYWFGVIEGLLKMSSDNAQGQPISFCGLSLGGWFRVGSVLK